MARLARNSKVSHAAVGDHGRLVESRHTSGTVAVDAVAVPVCGVTGGAGWFDYRLLLGDPPVPLPRTDVVASPAMACVMELPCVMNFGLPSFNGF